MTDEGLGDRRRRAGRVPTGIVADLLVAQPHRDWETCKRVSRFVLAWHEGG